MLRAAPEKITLYTRVNGEPYRPREPVSVTQGFLGNVALENEVVTAIESPLLGRLDQRRLEPHDIGEEETPWHITLPLPAAQRFRKLYKRIIFDNNVVDYDCRTLPAYVLGHEKTLLPGYRHTCPQPVIASTGGGGGLGGLEPGAPYAVLHEAEGDIHSFMGLDGGHPAHMLSILGRRGLLAVTHIPETLAAYDSSRFEPVRFAAA